MCGVELLLRHRRDAVLVEVLRHPGAHPLETGHLAVGPRLCRDDLRCLEGGELPALMRRERHVPLLELAVRQPDDLPGLVTVQDELAILALQTDAVAASEDKRDERADEEAET